MDVHKMVAIETKHSDILCKNTTEVHKHPAYGFLCSMGRLKLTLSPLNFSDMSGGLGGRRQTGENV